MWRWGNGTRALIGLWILAGLAVAGVNGYALLSLLDEPLAGYSSQVLQADQGFRQYRERLAAETQKLTSGMDLLARRFSPEPALAATPMGEPAAVPAAATEKRPTVAPPPVVLPRLAGIVTSRSAKGILSRLALFEGGVYSQGARIGDFTIKDISADGVRLTQKNKTWLLKVPEAAYSLTTR